MSAPRAVIIGGGIGGLAAAVALHRHGWAVTVLERARTLEPVGAGVALAPNGQRALDTVDAGEEVRALATWHGAGGLRLPGGRWLSRTDSSAAAERYGGPVVVLHRAELIGLLAARLPAGAVRTASRAELVDAGGPDRPARVRLLTAEPGAGQPRTGPRGSPGSPAPDPEEGAQEWEAELVVGADGIHSGVRSALFPDHSGLTYSGHTTWRFVTSDPQEPYAPHETWGHGALWGTVPLPGGQTYCYAAARTPAGGRAAPDEPEGERAELLRRYADWHEPVPSLLAKVKPDQVLRHDVYAVTTPLPAHHRGRVALLGDAAHAMPPFLGQGGNQALEDAAILAHHVGPPGGALEERLAAYTDDRLPRTTRVVQGSVRAGRFALPRTALATRLRVALVAAVDKVGPRFALRALDGIADWAPPGHPYAAGAQRTEAGAGRADRADRVD